MWEVTVLNEAMYFLNELEGMDGDFEVWYKGVKFERLDNRIRVHFPDRILTVVLPPHSRAAERIGIPS